MNTEEPKEEEQPIGETYSTVCDHLWNEDESDPNSDLMSVRCLKCWAGASVSKSTQIIAGKLVSHG